MKKKVLIPVFLAAIALPVCLNKGASSVNADYIGEFGVGQSKDRTAYIEHASAVQDQLAEEGFVLLKNKDNYLPRDTQGMKVSLAGKSSVNLARGGAGSGSGSVSNGVADYQLMESAEGHVKGALTEVGMELNQTLIDFYGTWTYNSQRDTVSFSNNSKSGSGRSNGNDGWKGNSEVVIGETPLSSYSAELLATLDEYNDAAIQVITREGM